MPATAAAYAAGEICGRHVDLFASCNRQWRNAEFADSEALLVNLCRTPFFGVAHRGIEYWKPRADADVNAADRDTDARPSGPPLVSLVQWRGELVIDGALDPVGGEIVKSELDRLCEQFRLEDLRDGVERTPTAAACRHVGRDGDAFGDCSGRRLAATNGSCTTHPTGALKRPGGVGSPGPCGGSSRSTTAAATTPRAVTNPPSAATSIT